MLFIQIAIKVRERYSFVMKVHYSKPKSLKKLLAAARYALDAEGHMEDTVTVQFATMKQMHDMKLKFIGKDQEVVDVLSFPLGDFPDPENPGSLGDIYLNWDAFKDDYEHLRFLLVHGVLHLLGYNHDEKHDILVMEKLERTLCLRIASLESTSDQTK